MVTPAAKSAWTIATAMKQSVARTISHRPAFRRPAPMPSDAALNCRAPASGIEVSAAIYDQGIVHKRSAGGVKSRRQP